MIPRLPASKCIISICVCYLFILNCYSQLSESMHSIPNDNEWIRENDALHPCITDDEYQTIQKNCNSNAFSLELQTTVTPGSVLLNWPLQAAQALHDCSYYYISAYVDQNIATGAIQDFNCGTNTYDSHRGTDISTWPFNFFKMDNNLVFVIAAASGTIVDKHDGEFDKNCATNSMTANYIVIQHDDGSRALYWHMKKNSLTTKAIGQAVLAGELLGVVGSSGNASGPHLHFEVWSGSTVATRIDPFAGTCNSLNQKSWWANQKAYTETAIIKASVNTTDLVLPPCPATEIPNESSVFQIPFQGSGLPAGYAKFYIFIRNEKTGLNADMSIINPDGSNFLTWTYSSPSDNKTRIQGWSKKLPTAAGKYIFKSVYNGMTCSTPFEMVNPTNSNNTDLNSLCRIYPNPSNGKFVLETEQTGVFEIYTLFGARLFQTEIHNHKSEFNLPITKGLFYYHLIQNNMLVRSGKLHIK